MDQRISLITLGVADLERSASFYEALGWSRAKSEDGIVVFDLIGQALGLYPRQDLAAELGLETEDVRAGAGITLAYNVREREEVAAVLDRVVAAGGRVLKPAQDVFWGGHHGYFADLDGHIWEVAHNPFSPLGPGGEFQWGGAE